MHLVWDYLPRPDVWYRRVSNVLKPTVESTVKFKKETNQLLVIQKFNEGWSASYIHHPASSHKSMPTIGPTKSSGPQIPSLKIVSEGPILEPVF